MSIHKKTFFASVLVTASIGLSSIALGDTCPTDLKRDHDGFWYSDAKPGWKSHKAIAEEVSVSSNDFGGIVYSPQRQRIACVYKGSDGKWVALVSNVHHNIIVDKKAMDDSGKQAAWQYNEQYKDYACGQPTVSKITGCPFQLSD